MVQKTVQNMFFPVGQHFVVGVIGQYDVQEIPRQRKKFEKGDENMYHHSFHLCLRYSSGNSTKDVFFQ